MIIVPYINKTNSSLYFRVKLNKLDLDIIRLPDNLFYQLKCIGATPAIFENKNIFTTENLEFNDRLFPSILPGERKRKKAVFGIMLTNRQKKSFDIIIKIEFLKNKIIRFKDIYILNRHGELLKKFIEPRDEIILALELEKIYKVLFDLPKQLDACKTCKYFYEYQANGYCIKYHPESRIPSDF
ncbi:MAG: hypothetical protein PHN88_04700 [Ignavibacteria bacterium]|nr:hypothetical protein [Ignavibacteria bacterium]